MISPSSRGVSFSKLGMVDGENQGDAGLLFAAKRGVALNLLLSHNNSA